MTTATQTDLDTILAKLHDGLEFAKGHVIEQKENLVIIQRAIFTPRAHTLILGPPGVAKSMLFNLDLKFLPQMRVFKTPAFKGSPPEQFLGPISLAAMTDPADERYERIVKNKLGWAEYVLVDELFRAPRTVLPSFQTAMSDNEMDNGAGMIHVPLRTFFGATNSIPAVDDDDLGAFMERFLFRLVQGPVQSSANFIQVMRNFLDRRAGQDLSIEPPDELLLTRDEVDLVTAKSAEQPVSDEILDGVAELRASITAKGIYVSARRWNTLLAAMQTDSLLSGHSEVLIDSLQLAKHALWNDEDERKIVTKEVLKYASEYEKETARLRDAMDPISAEHAELQEKFAQTGPNGVTPEMNNDATKMLRNIGLLKPAVEKHIGEATGRDTSRLQVILEEMATIRGWISRNILGGLLDEDA